jgi:hypothetical protein
MNFVSREEEEEEEGEDTMRRKRGQETGIPKTQRGNTVPYVPLVELNRQG